MKHSFDVEIARKYDIPTAVLLENLFFWIEKTKLIIDISMMDIIGLITALKLLLIYFHI